MSTFFEQHFWVVRLAGTALLAFAVAGAMSDFIAGELFARPAATWSQPRAGPDDGAPMASELGRVPASEQALEELGGRRIFRLDDVVPVVAAVKPQTPIVDPGGAPTRSGELTESQLPINLMGTFVSAVPDYSYATLQIEGEAKVASLGSEYLEGKAKVVKIARGHVVLREDASYTYVNLWADASAAGANPPPANLGATMATLDEGITKTGAYAWTLDRKMLDEQLADISKLQLDARPVPHYQDNQYQGIKLASVRPNSLFRAIGIRSGDIVKSVNGTAIDSPTKALELFEQLKSASNIAVEIERRGQPRTLSYSIQ